jgi:hypothetical protein
MPHRVTVMAKCFGPDASAVMKGRLMSVLVVLLSSHLACRGTGQRKGSVADRGDVVKGPEGWSIVKGWGLGIMIHVLVS